ncbi:hypothetical protein EMCRGX_G010427 [Ephydatia muelleri]
MITLKTLVAAAVQFISWALLGNSQQPANGVALYSRSLSSLVANNTFFSQDNVGGSFPTSLDCYTASGATSVGVWYYPSGAQVPSSYAAPYYTLRNPSRISLFKTTGGLEGVYTCRIPDERGVEQILCVGIYATTTIQSSHGPILLPPVVFQLLTELSQSPPSFSLTIKSTSSPPTIVVWTRNGVTFNNTMYVALTDGASANYTTTLVVEAGSGGVYQFTLSNVAGSSSTSIEIAAQSPPTNLVVTQLGCESVLVSWTPPPLAPGGYLLQYGSNGSFISTLLLRAAPQGAISHAKLRDALAELARRLANSIVEWSDIKALRPWPLVMTLQIYVKWISYVLDFREALREQSTQ